jgi:anti-anti-sigma factor
MDADLAPPGNFDVVTDRDGSVLRIAPHGEIDLATVDLVREAIERDHDGTSGLALDLREVGFMDTSGLRLVLSLADRAASEGFELRVVRGPATVQRVFEVAGLESRLPFVDEPSQSPGAE